MSRWDQSSLPSNEVAEEIRVLAREHHVSVLVCLLPVSNAASCGLVSTSSVVFALLDAVVLTGSIEVGAIMLADRRCCRGVMRRLS